MHVAWIAAVMLAVPPAAAAEGVAITPVFSGETTAAGQPIVLPSGPVRVVVSRFVIGVGATLPVHQHKFQRYAYVSNGTLQVIDDQSGVATTYRAGDFVVEMVGRWHHAANIGTEPVELLVIDQMPPGEQNTTLRGH